MKLEKHLAQGHLVYLSHQQDAMSVSENNHYRWMAFNDVVQSIMLIRKPSQLTLPHHLVISLPLLFFKPKQVVELGLGGGNLTRYLSFLSDELTLTSVEHSQAVIDCFNQYFNPESATLNIVHADGMTWLSEGKRSDLQKGDSNGIDWIICDVYQSKSLGFNAIVKQLETIVAAITAEGCASINLPDISDNEVQLCLSILQQLSRHHRITYFTVPNYLNIIMHVTPKHWPLHRLINKNKHSYLTVPRFNRCRKLWQLGQS